jgi:hypothetical protein
MAAPVVTSGRDRPEDRAVLEHEDFGRATRAVAHPSYARARSRMCTARALARLERDVFVVSMRTHDLVPFDACAA